MPKYTTSDIFTQASGAQEVKTPNKHLSTVQVSIGGDAVVGSLEIKAKYHYDATFETVYEEDGVTPLTVDLSDKKSFQLLDKWVHSIQVTPTGVVGSYTVCMVSGDE